ncbi:receptor-type guanylate cyclase Gyc76C-like [Ostrea edulis]|uniref:receptor-type guanylate cyclase Gyc76C-like n=1 Tax=Ostrea edulis TaxID=37623 RepID=UPI0024AEA3EE|nr:receptor-type guanylate cyclase Gyc76C-like [Ostrea edulis]
MKISFYLDFIVYVISLSYVIRVSVCEKTNITVGYLTVDKTDKFIRNRQGRIISGAITYALQQINADPNILPNHTLNLIWGDTRGDTLTGVRLLTDQWRQGVVAFFGLEDSCSVEARVAAAWNLPLISYKCADDDVSIKSKYPTFARTYPPVTQVTKSLVALLLHFNWRKFTMVVGSSHKQQTIAEKLLEYAEISNITVNDRQEYTEPYMPFTNGNPFPGIVDRSYVDTRVYVFLGDLNGVVDLMTNLYDRGLLDTGEYIVIFVDHVTFDRTDPLKYFKRTIDNPEETRNVDAARSLLIITLSPYSSENYTFFQDRVRKFNEEPPFSFYDPFPAFAKLITVYAAYLYDAVILYAKAAHKLIESGGEITNGTAIIHSLLNQTYESIQGTTTFIDQNGDAEGNYTLLARMEIDDPLTKYSMQPVGHFQSSDGSLPVLRLYGSDMIDWVSGYPPDDEPDCGYRRERCIPPKQYTLEIVLGTVGVLLLISLIVVLIVYRNWKYEQEIAGLLWKVDKADIHASVSGHKNAEFIMDSEKKEAYGSKLSLNSQQSMDSRASNQQVYAATSYYKGQLVAIKKYEIKSLVINRKMQKEMKVMRDLRHSNVNAFIGACIDHPRFIILTEYCSKGSLQDILENEDVKLDDMFIASMIKDMIQGLLFLHNSELGFHGNLKSSNCVVNSRWTLQVSDFGLLDIRAKTYRKEDEHAYYRNLFWRAPEELRSPQRRGSPKGDVYAFGIILHEIFGRWGPFGFCNMVPKDIVYRVMDGGPIPFRPDTGSLKCEKYVIDCMVECWSELPEDRPDFRFIYKTLHKMREGMKRNIFDQIMTMMESYQNHLEELVESRTIQLADEKRKTETLLHRMLPRPIADQLMQGHFVKPEVYNSVTVYFSDICGFTQLSAEITPMEVVQMLNSLYTMFDSIIKNYDVYKVETIGDAYMVVSGLPIRNGDTHAGEIASMSLELLRAITTFRIAFIPSKTLKLRIGMHSGPCVAGVVGLTMPRYTLFGDTVNTASRMESNGEPLQIHCSESSKEFLDKLGGYTLEPRGLVEMKGKGQLFTYWLVSEEAHIRRQRLQRCSQTLKMNTTWARATRQAYLQFCKSDDNGEQTADDNQPLMDIFRENENHSINEESPKIKHQEYSSPLEIRSFSSKLRYIPNGIISEDKRFSDIKIMGSGQDIVERTALISNHDFYDSDIEAQERTRHLSVGNRTHITLVDGTRERPSSARNNNREMYKLNSESSPEYQSLISDSAV